MTAATNENLLVLLGGGGHAAVVADAARARGWHILGYLDDDASTCERASLVDLTYLGEIRHLPDVVSKASATIAVHAAVGSGELREQWLEFADDLLQPAIAHPTAVISQYAIVDSGTFIGPGAIINARAHIGRACIINSAAVIEHDCVIGDFAHIAPGSVLGGGAHVGSHALIGSGAIILPRIRIGAHATLGAGAVATADIAARVTAKGVPARIA